MIYKLALPGEKIAVADLPLSQWTVVTPSTVQISGNSIINTGSGGWVESAYVSFTVPSTGSYTVSYDYDFANGYVGNWAYYGFGLFISPNGPPPQDSWTYYENSSNRVGYVLANPSTSIEGWKGTVTFTTTLNAGTTYYLWFPGGALNDGVTYTLTFKNIAIYNDPIQYTPSRDIKFNGTRVTYEEEDPLLYIDKFYPVGTYYETTVDTFDPNVSWVGTWVRDSDGLVLKAGISPETTGGEITHTLTVDELPSHSHRTTRQMMAAGRVSTATRGNDHFTGRYYDWTYVYNSGTTQPYKSGNRTSSGPTNTSSGHNNVQKSMICYRWHRVA